MGWVSSRKKKSKLSILFDVLIFLWGFVAIIVSAIVPRPAGRTEEFHSLLVMTLVMLAWPVIFIIAIKLDD